MRMGQPVWPSRSTLPYQSLGHPRAGEGGGMAPPDSSALSNLCWTEHPEIWGFRGNKHSGDLKDSVMVIMASIVIFSDVNHLILCF